MRENELGTRVIGCAIEVHRELGPGLLESIYESALQIELQNVGLVVQRQVPILVRYKGQALDEGFKADLIVENCIILELKSVEALKEVLFGWAICSILIHRSCVRVSSVASMGCRRSKIVISVFLSFSHLLVSTGDNFLCSDSLIFYFPALLCWCLRLC
jgi:GxxExxY protein